MNTIKDYWATSNMIKQWKESDIEKVAEVAFGEDAHKRYTPEEIIERLQEMSNSALEWESIQDDNDYEEIHRQHQLERLGSI